MKYILICVLALFLCALTGVAAATWIGRRHKLSKPGRTALAAGITVLLLCGGSLGYLMTYYKADDSALACLRGESGPSAATPSSDTQKPVRVDAIDGGYLLDGPGTETAILFYPGAKVDEAAYAPLLYRLAEGGVDCILVKAPFHFAFLGHKAEEYMSKYSYPDWYIAGHSLGGVVAAKMAAQADRTNGSGESPLVKGLVLLASYPTEKLPDSCRLLSVYGSEDGCLNRAAYAKSREFWPQKAQELVIEGGNHAQFGAYGLQNGDGTAAIKTEEQMDRTAGTILEWMK